MLQWRQPCSEQWLTCGSPAGPNEEGISPDGRRGRKKAAQGKKGILCVELNAGQMIEDVRLAVHDNLPVKHFGRLGGIIPSPDEVLAALKERIIK